MEATESSLLEILWLLFWTYLAIRQVASGVGAIRRRKGAKLRNAS